MMLLIELMMAYTVECPPVSTDCLHIDWLTDWNEWEQVSGRKLSLSQCFSCECKFSVFFFIFFFIVNAMPMAFVLHHVSTFYYILFISVTMFFNWISTFKDMDDWGKKIFQIRLFLLRRAGAIRLIWCNTISFIFWIESNKQSVWIDTYIYRAFTHQFDFNRLKLSHFPMS